MAIQKGFSKKKAKKVIVPKKQLLGHKAVKSLVKLSKTVRTNIIRKYLRKLKDRKDEKTNSEDDLVRRISDLKDLNFDAVESQLRRELFTDRTEYPETETPSSIVLEIVRHKLITAEIDSWKIRLATCGTKESRKNNSKAAPAQPQKKVVPRKIITLNKKERTTAIFVESLAGDDDSADDEAPTAAKTSNYGGHGSHARSNMRRGDKRGTLRQPGATRKRPKEQPDLNSYKPVGERSNDSRAVVRASSVGSYASGQRYQSPRDTNRAPISWKQEQTGRSTTQPQRQKGLHPSWEAKLKLKKAVSTGNIAVGVAMPQAKKIRFED